MKFQWKTALLLCFVTAVANAAEPSQNLDELLPQCAVSCLSAAVVDSPCSPTNTTCTCTNAQVQEAMTSCVLKNCTVKETLLTKNLASRYCNEPIRNEARQHIVLTSVFGGLAFMFIAQRIMSKIFWGVEFKLDDWFMLVAALFGGASLGVNQFGLVANGLGRDIWAVPFDRITKFGKLLFVLEVLYFLQVMLLKMSLLWFYYRIFPTKTVRRVLLGTLTFTFLFGIIFAFVAIFQCKPISFFWKKWDHDHHGHCYNTNTISSSNAVISIAINLWMLTIPLSQLSTLDLNGKKKIGVGIMFFVGALVTMISIIRLQYLVRYQNSANQTWDYQKISRWTVLECSIGQICVCLPAARVVLARLSSGIFGSTKQPGPYCKHGNGRNGGPEYPERSGAMLTDPARAQKYSYQSQVNPGDSVGHIDPVGIIIDRTYAVDYGEIEDVQLVNMKDSDCKSYVSHGTL